MRRNQKIYFRKEGRTAPEKCLLKKDRLAEYLRSSKV